MYVYDDGGRAAAGYKGQAGDCACRAVAIALGMGYQQAYDFLNMVAKEWNPKLRKMKSVRGISSARNGYHTKVFHDVMARLGWGWTPTMKFGQGCTTHLTADELPRGRIICNVSKHYVAVVNGVIHDTHDPSRGGTRCVYGYWSKA